MTKVDDYLKGVEPWQLAEFKRVRKIVMDLVPGAEEVISYKQPAFRLHEQIVIWVGAFKKHMSIFPGTIKFTEDAPLSDADITRIVQDRIRYNAKHPKR